MGGWFFQEIIPLCGSILQAGSCQILSLAENPRWSRVWQKPHKATLTRAPQLLPDYRPCRILRPVAGVIDYTHHNMYMITQAACGLKIAVEEFPPPVTK